MSPLLLALSLFLIDPAPDAPVVAAEPATATAETPPPAEAPFPTGAPRGDYEFVGWCYGNLRGYLDMHDEVMPDVTRIESTWRKPGTKLSDDMKVYADMQKKGRGLLVLFQSAITAAEKASLRPINQAGAEAVRRGRNVWAAGPQVTTARKAQEWMSWTLPDRCETTARKLEASAKLAGPAFQANVEPAAETPPPEAPPPEAPSAKPAPAEPAPTPPAT